MSDVFPLRPWFIPHKQSSQALFVALLQIGSSYGNGYQGASTQSTQQPQGYDASNSSYAAADQQGYSAGQTDYSSSQQVLHHFANIGQATYHQSSSCLDKCHTYCQKWVDVWHVQMCRLESAAMSLHPTLLDYHKACCMSPDAVTVDYMRRQECKQCKESQTGSLQRIGQLRATQFCKDSNIACAFVGASV